MNTQEFFVFKKEWEIIWSNKIGEINLNSLTIEKLIKTYNMRIYTWNLQEMYYIKWLSTNVTAKVSSVAHTLTSHKVSMKHT